MLARPVRRAALGLAFILAITPWGEPRTAQAQPPRSSFSAGDLVETNSNRALTQANRVRSGDATYDVWRLEFRTPEQCKAAAGRSEEFGVWTASAFDRFWCFLAKSGEQSTLTKLNDLIKTGGLVWWEQEEGEFVPPPPPTEVLNNRVTFKGTEEIVRGGITVGDTHYTGKGVILAIIDTGLDFRHPDFIKMNGGQKESRLLYFWDTYSTEFDQNKRGTAPGIAFKFPNRASVGTLYKREQLTADLRGATPAIPEPDGEGHGTSCAGVAGGNGNAVPGTPYGRYAGVAPEVDLIGVRISHPERGFSNSFLFGNMIEWLQSVAKKEGKPLVVSCSFGSQSGGRDGYRIKERELAARFADDTVGQALCISAGNERDKNFHARAELKPGGEAVEFAWLPQEGYQKNEAKEGFVNFYVNGVTKVNDLAFQPGPSVKAYKPGWNPLSESAIFGFSGPASGSVKVKNNTNESIFVDAYVHCDVPRSKGWVRFAPAVLSMQHLCGTPAASSGAITIGSYDFNSDFDFQGQSIAVPVFPYMAQGQPMQLGGLSAYSSPGYLRKGNVKPDVTAPGQWHIAPVIQPFRENFASIMAKNPKSVNYHDLLDTSGHYAIFNGTSASTPYTAGIVALMFEKNKKLTTKKVKELLHNHATKIGAKPNVNWGYGKLDIAAVRSIMTDPALTR